MTVEELRAQFPALGREVYGKPLVYLDNAASSQRPRIVVEKLEDMELHHNGNVHRAVHALSNEATDAFENARYNVGRFIHARESKEIVFTSGTTASINLVASSFGEKFIAPGDEIIIAESEHHSNIVPWQQLAQRRGALIKVLPVDDNGRIEAWKLPSLLTPRTRIVCVAQVSNVTGLVAPLEEIISIAHKAGACVLVDGAQGIVHQEVDVQTLDCDFYAFSAHKMYGPTGVGVLYGKSELLEQMPPYMGGGEMIDSVTWEKTTYDRVPFKFEAGTPNFNSVPAIVPAIETLQLMRAMEIVAAGEEVKRFVYNALTGNPRIRLYGLTEDFSQKVPVFSFNVEGAHHEDLALLLDKMGFALRSGHMCAQPLMRRFGVSGMLRASFAPYNTLDEARSFVAALERAIAMLS